jgi:NitT/TauT family transport system substrate-binding protein
VILRFDKLIEENCVPLCRKISLNSFSLVNTLNQRNHRASVTLHFVERFTANYIGWNVSSNQFFDAFPNRIRLIIDNQHVLLPASIRPQERITIGLAGQNFSFLPFQIAQEKGFYRKHGLEVQSVWMRAQASIPALVSGDIDYDTHFGSVIRAALRGLELRIIFSAADRQMYSFVVQPEIKSVADLKGKVIGISSFGAAQHLVTAGVLKAVGLNPDRDVKMITIGNEAVRIQQLRRKQISAAMINPPMSIMMKHDGFNLLLHAADYLELPLTGLGVTTKKLRENPEQVRKVLRAVYEALQFVRNNKKETVEISSRWLRLDPSISAET